MALAEAASLSLQGAVFGFRSWCPKSYLNANLKALLNLSPISFLEGSPVGTWAAFSGIKGFD